MGKKEFSKNYVLLVPVNAEEDENGEVEIKLTHSSKMKTEQKAGTAIPEDSEDRMEHDWRSLQQLLWKSKNVQGTF